MRIDNIEDIYRLTPIQQEILRGELKSLGSSPVQLCSYILDGNLNVAAFEQAWQHMLRGHQALRAIFQWEDLGEPVQVVSREVSCSLSQYDWRALSADEQAQKMEQFLAAEREHQFDPRNWPLLRMQLICSGSSRYYLVWSFHRLLLDRRSQHLILTDLFACYESICNTGEFELKPARFYKDYFIWLREQDLAGAEAFWAGALQGWSPSAVLTRRPSSGGPCASAKEEIALSLHTSNALRSLAQRHQLNTKTIFLGAWSLLLSRYLDSPEIVFGMSGSDRPASWSAGKFAVGAFSNLVPVRIEITSAAIVSLWLKRLEDQYRKISRFDQIALPTILGWNGIDSDQAPLESVLFFDDGGQHLASPRSRAGIKILPQEVNIEQAHPVVLEVYESRRLVLHLALGCAVFLRESAGRVLGHLETLLEAIIVDSERQLASLPMLTEEEQRQLLAVGAGIRSAEPSSGSLCDPFEAQTDRAPERIALRFGEAAISYGDLNERANQLAHRLRRLGVGPEVIVGVCAERSIKTVIAFLGILKAGGVYLPLDPKSPQERLSYLLADARVRVLLTEQHLIFNLSISVAASEIIYLDSDWPEIAQESTENPRPCATGLNLAYVIYTSGSTGRPKAVCISHEAAANHLIQIGKLFALQTGDQALQFASLSFDVSIEQILTTLFSGATLVLRDERHWEAADFYRQVKWYGLTAVNLPPSYWNLLAQENSSPGRHWSGDPIRLLIVGGDIMPASVARQWQQRAQGASRLLNAYGPTETTITSTLFEVPHRYCDQESVSRIPIGRPIAGRAIYILDRQGNMRPPGTEGELCIGGSLLARGYLNDPKQTAERFVPDPWSAEGGGRLYRTGDRARFQDDEQLEFLGRLDNQVKIRGFRVELAEIESAICQSPIIKEAIVIDREEVGGDKQLIAYVVLHRLNGDGPTRIDALRDALKERLPDYMIPAAFIVVGELPMTLSGKVDRRAIRFATPLPDQSDDHYVAPQTPVEEMLAGIFEKVLKVDRIGVRDNFFEIGGHSLLATQVASRARIAFGVELGVGSIFEEATVEGLARSIEQAMKARKQGPALPPLVRVSREGKLPLSFAQQRLWFIEQLEPGSARYNCPYVARLVGRLNLEAFEKVINEIIRRHEVLRTRIDVEEGQAVQVVEEWRPRRLEVEELKNQSPGEKELSVRRMARAEAETGFDLKRGALLRVKVLKLGGDEYVVFFTMHHVVGDEWSIGILIREINRLYQAYSQGLPSPLEDLPIQYADFAVWQRQWLKGELLEEELKYWRKQLAGMEDLILPADRPRPSVKGYRGARSQFILEREVAEKLRALSQREGVTLFMTLLGCFKVVMSRYSGQEDVVIGTDIANRNRSELEGVIGFFVNQLVLRTEVRALESFEELLKRVREVCLGAYAHQDLPFEKLVEALQPERNLGQSPLFKAKLILQNAPRQTLELEGVGMQSFTASEMQTARFDLMMAITNSGHDLVGVIEYSRDLFEERTIERLMCHYTNVLKAIGENSRSLISDLSLLGDEERTQILVEWNRTERPRLWGNGVHTLFAERVRLSSERIALIDGGQQVSYGELNRRANQLGRYLRRLGVGPDIIVGVCLRRSVTMVVGLMGVLKAGGAYLPLDPESPSERLSYMMEDAGVRVVITEGELEGRLPAFWGQTICLDEEWERIGEESENNPESEVEAENLAYVIYTSGSTGRPKGVMIDHGGVVNYLKWATEAYRIEGGGAPVNSSIGFDLTVTSLYGPLINGESVDLLSEREGIEALTTALSQGRWYSLVKVTPAHLEILARQLGETAISGGTKVLVIGGEELKAAGLEFWRKSAPGTRLINEYGPTETVVGCCVYEAKAGESEREAVPIGRPIANTQMYVLGKGLEPVPVGARGEIFIAGAGVARGYLGRPELTGARFIPNPFGQKGGERLYQTGDLGRYLSDGNLEYIGRTDDQVKIRGYRIELGEIEAILSEHDLVKQGVVIASEDEEGNRRLLGYVVEEERGAGRKSITSEGLKDYLRKKLPEYMLPAELILLEEMPLSANGKIDRHALRGIEVGRADSGKAQDLFQTPTEELLSSIWARGLGVKSVGRHDNFFNLGGHSLLATSLVVRVRDAFHVEMPIQSLFEHATVAAWARRIDKKIQASQGMQLPPLVARPRSGELPLSFAQQRLWFLDQLAPDSRSNNIPGAVRLKGPLRTESLEKSLNEIIRRHESLRTRIVVDRGEPKQVVDAPMPRILPIEDLSGLPEMQREAEVERRITEEAKQRFDLSSGALLRTSLLRLSVEEYVLLVTMHHLISDGWSFRLFVQELASLYESFNSQQPVQLSELPIQFGDYALWLREWLQGETLERQLTYWVEQLAGAPPFLELPGDRPRPIKQRFRGAVYPVTLSEDLTAAIKDLGRGEEVTLFMVLLAALNVLLNYRTGQEDIVVGTDVANRNHVETERLIGFFVNQLVLRTSLTGTPTFQEILRRVREVALGAYAHQDLPFEKLVEALKPERNLKHSPLFQVKLVFQNTPLPPFELAGLSLEPIAVKNDVSRLDLTLLLGEEAQRLEGCIEYNTDLFNEATIARLATLFEAVLQQVVKDPWILLSELNERLLKLEQQLLKEEAEEKIGGNLIRFKNIKPQSVKIQIDEAVPTDYLLPGPSFPLLIQPRAKGVDLVDWGKRNSELIEHEVSRCGALLFRGFHLSSVSSFEQFAKAICPLLFNDNGEHPREAIGGSVYTPVFYPPDKQLLWHNENSFNHQWPMKIWFCCFKPADYGGETPIVDSRKVFEAIPPNIREQFIRKGVMYVRNYGEGLGLTWQQVFQTTSRLEVERRCRMDGVDFEWKDGDRLMTRAVRPAVAKHPRNGEMVWFNQAQHWHPHCLDPITRESLMALFGEESLPRNCYYGDGSAIEDSVMSEILEIYRTLEVSFPWHRWDVLLLDNMLSAHGRNPFIGERKLFVAMGDMLSYNEI